jgi:CheY-like chemotaxis protein
MKTSRPRILAIEADPDRRRQLERFLRERVNADVAVAESAPAAVRAIDFQSPDLVVASMLLPPRDDAQVMEHLNTIDVESRPPVLVVPPLYEPADPSPVRRLMHRFGWRRLAPFPLYDADAIGSRIKDALEEAVPEDSRVSRVVEDGRDLGRLAPTAKGRTLPAVSMAPLAPDAPLVLPPKRVTARAHRWTPAELPWVFSVQTPIGLDARVINVSRSGILIESGSKLPYGSIATVHLSGMGTALVVPAHVIRSEVASVEVVGVKYWIAAEFNGRLDPLPEDSVLPASVPVPAPPATLTELLAQVSTEAERGRRVTDLQEMFEEGVRQLASAHEVKIRATPAPTTDRESIYFRVPSRSGSRAVLQVIFEPGHQPQANDLTLMKAAAAAAALVMSDEPPHARAHHAKGDLRNSW